MVIRLASQQPGLWLSPLFNEVFGRERSNIAFKAAPPLMEPLLRGVRRPPDGWGVHELDAQFHGVGGGMANRRLVEPGVIGEVAKVANLQQPSMWSLCSRSQAMARRKAGSTRPCRSPKIR